MKSHAVVLKYLFEGPNELEFSNPSCALCEAGRAELLKAQSPQLKLMEPIPKFGRLRPRDLHEAPIMASCSKLSAEISATDICSVRGAKVISTDTLEESSSFVSRSLMLELSESSAALQKILSELKVSELPISKEDIRRMVELVRKHSKAFAISLSYVGRTHLATHKIDVGTNPLFKEQFRPVPHAWREFLK